MEKASVKIVHNGVVRMKKIISVVIIVSILIATFLFFGVPLIISQTSISQQISKAVEQALGCPVEFDRLRMRILPTPACDVYNIHVPSYKMTVPLNGETQYIDASLEAERIGGSIRLLPLAYRKVEVGVVSFKNMSLTVVASREEGYDASVGREKLDGEKGVLISLSEVTGYLRMRGPASYDFDLRCLLNESAGAIQGKGRITVDPATGALRKLQGQFMCKDVAVGSFSSVCNYLKLPLVFESGVINGTLRLEWSPDSMFVDSDMAVKTLVYTLWNAATAYKSTSIDGSVKGVLSMSLKDKTVNADSLRVTLGENILTVNGSASLAETGRHCSMSVHSDCTRLDSLVQLFPMLGTAIPLNVGFAGAVSYDVLIKEDGAASSLSGSMVCDKAVFGYGSVVTKPEGVPLSLDFRVESGDGRKTFHGDTTVLLGSMNLKTTVTNFDLATGDIEGSFISNSFDTQVVTGIMPAASAYQTGGNIKVFGSCKGNVNELAAMKHSGGLVLDQVSCRAEDLDLRQLDASVKWSESAIEAKGLKGTINGSAIFGDATIRYQEPVHYTARLYGDVLDLSSLTKAPAQTDSAVGGELGSAQQQTTATASMVDQATLTSQTSLQFLPIENSQVLVSFNKILLSGNEIDSFSCRIHDTAGKLEIQECKGSIAGGTINVDGSLGIESYLPFKTGFSQAKLTVQNVALEQLRNGTEPLVAVMQGAVNGSLSVECVPMAQDPLQSLRGTGTIAITNGKLTNIDFLSIVSTITAMFSSTNDSKGFTEFTNLSTDLVIEDKKVTSNTIKMNASQFDIEGFGSFGFDSSINYTANVLMNEQISKKLLSSANQGDRLKIPVHVYNTVSEPKYSIEHSLMQALVGGVMSRGLQHLAGISAAANGSTSTTGGSSASSTTTGSATNILSGLLPGQTSTSNTASTSGANTTASSPVATILSGLLSGQSSQSSQSTSQDDRSQPIS